MKNLKNFDGFVNESSDSDHYGSNTGLSREFPPKITSLPNVGKIGGDVMKSPTIRNPKVRKIGGDLMKSPAISKYPTGIYLEYGFEYGPDYSFIESICISARDSEEAKNLFLDAMEIDINYLSPHLLKSSFGEYFVEGVLNDKFFSSEGWVKPLFDMIEVPVDSRTPMGTFVKETAYNAGSTDNENKSYQDLTRKTFQNFFGSSDWPGPLISFER